MKSTFLLLSFALLSAPAVAVERGLVAVLPLDARNARLDPATIQSFEESLRTAAGDSLAQYGYTVLTGETTLQLLQDNGVDADRVCDANCSLTAAREMKAQLFMSGSIQKSEGSFTAYVRMFEIATGQQVASVELEGASVQALRKSFRSKATEFFERIVTNGSDELRQSTMDNARRAALAKGIAPALLTPFGTPRTLHFQLGEGAESRYVVDIPDNGGSANVACVVGQESGGACDAGPLMSGKVKFNLFRGKDLVHSGALYVPQLGANVKVIRRIPAWALWTGIATMAAGVSFIGIATKDAIAAGSFNAAFCETATVSASPNCGKNGLTTSAGLMLAGVGIAVAGAALVTFTRETDVVLLQVDEAVVPTLTREEQ